MIFGLIVLAVAAITAVFPRWLELAGVDADGGGGQAELVIVITLVLLAVGLFARAWRKRLA